MILPPAPRWGVAVLRPWIAPPWSLPGDLRSVAPSLRLRCAPSPFTRSLSPAARPLPRLSLPAPGGLGPPAEDAPASLPAPEPPWPASCLTSPRASCPRLVAGPGVRTSPHGSRALRPLRASRLRGRGCASYAATPPPSGTPLPPWGACPRCPLLSLHAPPPLLRCGALRWPAPCGPCHPWQDGQGSIPARRSAPNRSQGTGHLTAFAVHKGGASRTGLISVAASGGSSGSPSHGASGATARHPWQAFAAPAFALSLPGRHGRLRSAALAGKPRWRFAHCLGWRGRALHPFWL